MKHVNVAARILLLLAPLGLGYLLAGQAMTWLWPGRPGWLVGPLLLLSGALPPVYVLWAGRKFISNEPVYLAYPLDTLLPAFILIVVVILAPFIGYRVALSNWGRTATGVVLDLYIQTYEDPDLGTTTHYLVTYEFRSATEQRYRATGEVGADLYSRLAVGDPLPINYWPWWPRLSQADDPLWLGSLIRLVLWGILTVLLWLTGSGVATWLRRRPPPPRAVLQEYGLDRLLSNEDDPALWIAVVAKHFPPPGSDKLRVESLRFGLARLAPETRYGLQPTQAWCFENGRAGRLQVTSCPPDGYRDAQFDKALEPEVDTVLFAITFAGNKWPYYSIVLPRPTVGVERVPVYTGAQWGFLHGYGHSAIWERRAGGWQETKEVLDWWRS